MPKTMYDEDDEDSDDVVDVPASRHDVPAAGQTEGQHQAGQQQHSQPAQHQPASPAPTLHAEWDKTGRCWVALFEGKKQLEKWRAPTEDEWNALRTRGNLTRASNAPMGAVDSAGQVASQGGTWWDKIKANAVPFALGGAVVYGALKVMADRADAAVAALEKHLRGALKEVESVSLAAESR